MFFDDFGIDILDGFTREGDDEILRVSVPLYGHPSILDLDQVVPIQGCERNEPVYHGSPGIRRLFFLGCRPHPLFDLVRGDNVPGLIYIHKLGESPGDLFRNLKEGVIQLYRFCALILLNTFLSPVLFSEFLGPLNLFLQKRLNIPDRSFCGEQGFQGNGPCDACRHARFPEGM